MGEKFTLSMWGLGVSIGIVFGIAGGSIASGMYFGSALGFIFGILATHYEFGKFPFTQRHEPPW